MTATEIVTAIERVISTYFLPMVRSEMRAVADATVCEYRQQMVSKSTACCEGWLTFYYHLTSQHRITADTAGQPNGHLIEWMGHTLVHCPFCGQKLKERP